MRPYWLLVLGLVFVLACNKKVGESLASNEVNQADRSQDYKKSIQQYRADREAELRKPTGWLSLVGLYWLDEGCLLYTSPSPRDRG